MSATSTDFFIYTTPTFSTTIGSGGVANGTVDVIPLDSVSNLSTTTAIELVINRIDATTLQETNNYETVRGVVSGTNLVSVVRGVEGTAQAWAAGTVVEYLNTADIQNRMVEGVLVEHGQDGKHTLLNTHTIPAGSAALVDISTAQTLTNKRITKRVYSATSASSLTPEISTYDEFAFTALAADLTINNHSTSTPADGDRMLITITPDATPRAISFGDKYVAKAGTALPTTTTASKTMVMGFRWDAGLGKWNLLALGTEA